MRKATLSFAFALTCGAMTSHAIAQQGFGNGVKGSIDARGNNRPNATAAQGQGALRSLNAGGAGGGSAAGASVGAQLSASSSGS